MSYLRWIYFAIFLAPIAFAQQVPSTQHSNVRIDPALSTTYRTITSKTINGVSVGSPNNNTGLSVKTGTGSISTTFINPKATINAVPESNTSVKGNINYNPKAVTNAYIAKMSKGFPVSAKGGWLSVIEATLGAHKGACKSGSIDFLCWGSLHKTEEIDIDSSLLACQKEHDLCYLFEGAVSYVQYTIIGHEGGLSDSEINALMYSGSAGASGINWSGYSENSSGELQKCGTVYYNRYPSYNYDRCVVVGGTPIYKEEILDYCSFADCDVVYTESFVPFTAQDLEGVPLEPDTMSDWDFAFVQDDVNPESVFIEEIPQFVTNNVVTGTDPVTGDSVVVETITTGTPIINNNNSAQPSVDVSVNKQENTYVNGSLTNSNNTTIIIKPDGGNGGGDNGNNNIDCSTFPEACNYFGFMQKTDDKYDDTRFLEDSLHVEDLDFNKKEYRFVIDAPMACPAPYVLYLETFDKEFTIPFDYLCQIMEILAFFIVGSAYITAIYICLGIARG